MREVPKGRRRKTPSSSNRSSSAPVPTTPILDPNALSNVRVETHPYAWASVQNLLPDQIALALARTFPEDGFESIGGANARYQTWERILVLRNEAAASVANLPPVWRELVTRLSSQQYREEVSRLASLNLESSLLSIRLRKVDARGWQLPHLDNPERLLTQLIYLTEGWDPAWGGAFQVLASMEEHDVVKEIPPLLNTSVLFVHSDRAFHAVTRVDASAPSFRRSLLLQFDRSS